MYKFVNGMLPSIFDDMFRYVNEIHGHFTRTSANLFVPFSRTSRGQKLIFYIGPTTWNYVISKINTDCAISTFKNIYVLCVVCEVVLECQIVCTFVISTILFRVTY